MFVQRDVLMMQIEQLARAMARRKAGKKDEVTEADVEQAVGLRLDVAEGLPPEGVTALLGGDGARTLALGLALARRAMARVDAGDFEGAARAALAAEPLIEAGARERPDLATPEVGIARGALVALWGGER